ncbi:MAG: transcriptional regulator, Crp/Fnr family [uncultured Thiotrichaceae bacterium]|uniref:Transcriptional regulator, Crp/Fnr family n=1 Tax=uncultured Thiotrichaceae bacterium TaxID=298394 RepID=A0A6S6S8K8_9GAMM|nr:MAG: transcriptional regulator, Crp/Fnr family [uncultured Thiotrichaceae bacterium]
MSHIIGQGQCATCKIRHLSIFAELEDVLNEDIGSFRPSVMVFDTAETVYRQQVTANNAFTLRKGVVKLIKMLPNGRSQIIRLLRKGDLFGFDGFAGEAYNHTAIAVTNIEVCRLPLNELMALKKKNPEIEQAMMLRWIRSLREAEDMMLELGAKKAPERLASFLFKWCGESGSWQELPLSRLEMGELLGLTIETVSRFLSDWKRKGLINESRGSIQIADAASLRELVCMNGSC